MADEGRGRAEALLAGFVGSGEIAGGALVALRRGEVLVEHYAGEAAPGVPAGPHALWPLASISKVYSVAAVMRLVERGALTLHTPVGAVLPAFRGGWRDEVRLRHLLTHTAGMIYESPRMEELLAAKTSLADMAAEAVASELLFRPGSAVSYADYHTLLAGEMAAAVAGEPFAAIVQREVLAPAGLADTFFPSTAAEDPRTAVVRGPLAEGTDGAMYNSRYARGLAHPAFGVIATARDLARFAWHFMPGGPRIHSEAAVRAMTSDQTGGVPGAHPAMAGYADGGPIPWGLGWYLQRPSVPAILCDLASPQAFGHGGASGCLIVADPAADLVVAVVSNTHVRTGPDRWRIRLGSLANCAFAAAG